MQRKATRNAGWPVLGKQSSFFTCIIFYECHVLDESQTEVDGWMVRIKKHTSRETLDRVTVTELIEFIEVSEADKTNGQRRQTVQIKYCFIGNLLEDAKEGIT